MDAKTIGIIGARSLIGRRLIPLLCEAGFTVHAITRKPQAAEAITDNAVLWHSVDGATPLPPAPVWVSCIPIWALPHYFTRLETTGIERLIAFSSTSLIAKSGSQDLSERKIAAMLLNGEREIENWGSRKQVGWVILRPTLIYDEGHDKNISNIVNIIRKFGFFPVAGKGAGLRMPVYAGDLAAAVIQLLKQPSLTGKHYTLSGGEALTYTDMVKRLFDALHKKPRIVHIPETLLAATITCIRLLPRFRHLSCGMAYRMQQDQAFSCDEARQDFGYAPHPFHPIFTNEP